MKKHKNQLEFRLKMAQVREISLMQEKLKWSKDDEVALLLGIITDKDREIEALKASAASDFSKTEKMIDIKSLELKVQQFNKSKQAETTEQKLMQLLERSIRTQKSHLNDI